MTLDPSEVKKIAVLCGAFVWNENIGGYCIGDTMFSAKQLQSFAQAIYAMGAAEQKEKDAKICEEFYSVEGVAQKCAESIRSQE